MMKKVMVMFAALLMVGSAAVAQQKDRRGGGREMDAKTRAERMTDRMVKEYSLNDTQKQQLLEANLAWIEKMEQDRGGRANVERKQLTDEQKAEMQKKREGAKNARKQLTDEQKAEMQKKREEMQNARKEYEAKLQSIMTKEQYQAYTKKSAEQRRPMPAGRGGGPRRGGADRPDFPPMEE